MDKNKNVDDVFYKIKQGCILQGMGKSYGISEAKSELFEIAKRAMEGEKKYTKSTIDPSFDPFEDDNDISHNQGIDIAIKALAKSMGVDDE